MSRFVRRVGLLLATFWLVLGGTASVAHADPTVTLSAENTCLAGGVLVTNSGSEPIQVRVDLDGSPALPGGPWFTVVANGANRLLGSLPSGAGVYTVYQKTDSGETQLGSVTYTRPDYCDNVTVTYDDRCSTIKASVANHRGSDVTISFIKISGSTYPIGSITVPSGQTGSVDLPITAEVIDIGAYDLGPGDYLNKYVVKGLSGACPTPTPTPTPQSPQSPAGSPSAGDSLPSTGAGGLVQIALIGLALVVVGIGVIFSLRLRFR